MAIAATPIEIVVTDVRSARGHVRIELCDESHFLKDCLVTGATTARIGSVTIVVPAVPPGRYAIQAYHDENDNRRLDRNLLGIPREGFAFSHDPRVCMGPPRFADTAFDHGGERQTLTLSIRYRLC